MLILIPCWSSCNSFAATSQCVGGGNMAISVVSGIHIAVVVAGVAVCDTVSLVLNNDSIIDCQ